MTCERNEEIQEIIIGSRSEFWIDVRQEGRVFPLDSFDSFELILCVPGGTDLTFPLTAPTNPSSGDIFVTLTAAQTATLDEAITDGYLKLDQTPSDPTLVPLENKFKIKPVC